MGYLLVTQSCPLEGGVEVGRAISNAGPVQGIELIFRILEVDFVYNSIHRWYAFKYRGQYIDGMDALLGWKYLGGVQVDYWEYSPHEDHSEYVTSIYIGYSQYKYIASLVRCICTTVYEDNLESLNPERKRKNVKDVNNEVAEGGLMPAT